MRCAPWIAFAVSVSLTAAQTPCVWGSFDATRINYAGGVLTSGSSCSNLRSIIQANGGRLAAPTSTLTSSYLASVQVFYTSLLHFPNGILSTAEQSALQAWVAAGGTLIVTGDVFPLAAYETFTAPYGVGHWILAGNCATGGTHADVVATHPITAGVTDIRYCVNGEFQYGTDARLLADDGNLDKPFLAVLEPATGFLRGGRVLVLGDHNLFTDSYIGFGDNVRFAANIVRWACGCPNAVWSNYGSGWPGASGVPNLTSSGPPVLGTSVNLQLGNSANGATTGTLLFGAAPAAVRTPLGGTLLVSPLGAMPLNVPARGLTLRVTLPNLPAFCGTSVFFQGGLADAGASHGVAFTRGLDLVLGQ